MHQTFAYFYNYILDNYGLAIPHALVPMYVRVYIVQIDHVLRDRQVEQCTLVRNLGQIGKRDLLANGFKIKAPLPGFLCRGRQWSMIWKNYRSTTTTDQILLFMLWRWSHKNFFDKLYILWRGSKVWQGVRSTTLQLKSKFQNFYCIKRPSAGLLYSSPAIFLLFATNKGPVSSLSEPHDPRAEPGTFLV
jgi:hypothetical protein